MKSVLVYNQVDERKTNLISKIIKKEFTTENNLFLTIELQNKVFKNC